jgi:hypothetical protein
MRQIKSGRLFSIEQIRISGPVIHLAYSSGFEK